MNKDRKEGLYSIINELNSVRFDVEVLKAGAEVYYKSTPGLKYSPKGWEVYQAINALDWALDHLGKAITELETAANIGGKR